MLTNVPLVLVFGITLGGYGQRSRGVSECLSYRQQTNAVLEVFSSPRALAYGGDDIWNAQESVINQRFPELRSNSFGGSFHVKVLQLISRVTLVALVVMLLPLVVQAQFGEPGVATLGVTGASVSVAFTGHIRCGSRMPSAAATGTSGTPGNPGDSGANSSALSLECGTREEQRGQQHCERCNVFKSDVVETIHIDISLQDSRHKQQAQTMVCAGEILCSQFLCFGASIPRSSNRHKERGSQTRPRFVIFHQFRNCSDLFVSH